MNSTQWATLTEFFKYLGRTGKCKVEETPKGWFITHIDRDSEMLSLTNGLRTSDSRQMLWKKRGRSGRSRTRKSGQNSCCLHWQRSKQKPESCPLQSEPTSKIAFSLGLSSKLTAAENQNSSKPAFEELEAEMTTNKHSRGTSGMKVGGSSALDDLMEEQEMAKERSSRKDYWLCEGIIVKVMSKGLADKGYYKQKGVVIKVVDKYLGEIEMLDSKRVLRVDQEEIETVIPQIGGLVRIVNGAYRGSNARLLSVDTDNYCAKVRLEKGIYDGRVLQAVDYEDICKIMQ